MRGLGRGEWWNRVADVVRSARRSVIDVGDSRSSCWNCQAKARPTSGVRLGPKECTGRPGAVRTDRHVEFEAWLIGRDGEVTPVMGGSS
jgi:hypothetical protein